MIRFLAAVLVATLAVGCSSDSDTPASDDAESSQSPSPSTSPAAPHPFSGDTSWLAYQTDRTGVEGVWLVHPDGTEDHQIVTDLPNALLPDWSPDGTHLVVTSRGDGHTEEPLFEYDLASDTSRQLFDCTLPCAGDDEPVYSPDGSQVAFIRAMAPFTNDLPADCSLWIGDRATGEVRQVTSNTKPQCDREYNPRWSPDGTRLTYWRQPSMDGKATVTAVFVINADGTDERRLTDPAMEAGESDWSPDGEWIVFATHPLAAGVAGASHLYRIHPDGSGREQLTDFTSDELRATQPQFTPDGEWIVFTAVTSLSRSLWAIPAVGGDPIEITNGGIYTHGTWQPTPDTEG